MTSNTDKDALIDHFFSALAQRDLALCQTIQTDIKALAKTDPTLYSWQTYLEGILVNEAEYDWAKATHIFTVLLQSDLEPELHGRVRLALSRSHDYQGHWAEAISACETSLALFDAPDQAVNRAKAWKQIARCYYHGCCCVYRTWW